MAAPMTSRILRLGARTTSRSLTRRCQTPSFVISTQTYIPRVLRSAPSARCFSVTRRSQAGIMPHTEEPEAPDLEPHHEAGAHADLSDEEYHLHADRYMETLQEKAEELQEGREDVEVDHAAGVLSITLPPNGTYIVNKQPTNKQIWLSSPLSGPKRYDWVVSGESMHQKEGGGVGDWVYIRDGTRLSALLRKEIGVSVDLSEDGDATKRPSVDPVE
ncbi:Mitochondrial matrix iron chaperone [Friedmanniomyces endolithicus]|uniref:ferroxidase n=1 Tax=Rachicladosporium monterosium TaxID=1507873 RepID=A0ABR0LD17_9PEZI|nr:Mitochondrial matrix iron chaperone [Friedmanniomyces endolithicus]KAK1093797.1 Mitochondrial matrix iron chaperone [Friedmanniomyces endolithicus]KAK1820949.1 Mitochondrial matrix iron chaperone [Friedmanniomyces endolithicus]KAK5147028.1 Mitochondrial matrix iron chaperone [Rachicladosporium monterosium]